MRIAKTIRFANNSPKLKFSGLSIIGAVYMDAEMGGEYECFVLCTLEYGLLPVVEQVYQCLYIMHKCICKAYT